jgi:hypothetical protein
LDHRQLDTQVAGVNLPQLLWEMGTDSSVCSRYGTPAENFQVEKHSGRIWGRIVSESSDLNDKGLCAGIILAQAPLFQAVLSEFLKKIQGYARII